MKDKPMSKLTEIAIRMTESVGSIASLIIHSIIFVVIFGLLLFGVSLDSILLILTTAVSLEAIYLAIFIQMTVNRNTQSLEAVEGDIDEIQGDIDELEKDVDEIQEDVAEDDITDADSRAMLDKIENGLAVIMKEVEELKKMR
jgi:peptidoglycan hydrolase CwlO-like protein